MFRIGQEGVDLFIFLFIFLILRFCPIIFPFLSLFFWVYLYSHNTQQHSRFRWWHLVDTVKSGSSAACLPNQAPHPSAQVLLPQGHEGITDCLSFLSTNVPPNSRNQNPLMLVSSSSSPPPWIQLLAFTSIKSHGIQNRNSSKQNSWH